MKEEDLQKGRVKSEYDTFLVVNIATTGPERKLIALPFFWLQDVDL